MRNFRHSIRALLNQPLFSAVVIITCALGIGANTAVFSVINAVLLRPLPFEQPARLVILSPYDKKVSPGGDAEPSTISYPDFADLRSQNQVFERAAVYTTESLTLTDGQEALQLQGQAVSAELFKLLGVQPAIGRAFLPEEDAAGSRVVVLSNDIWKRRFAADPAIVGKSITLDRQQFL
ncbi:MAG TPA: ABC transporter permease, partial [Chthoniobacterales bacterium]